MDVEVGGSGKTNIHLKVDDIKYYYDQKTGNFVEPKSGQAAPNKIAKNDKIQEAITKALEYAKKLEGK